MPLSLLSPFLLFRFLFLSLPLSVFTVLFALDSMSSALLYLVMGLPAAGSTREGTWKGAKVKDVNEDKRGDIRRAREGFGDTNCLRAPKHNSNQLIQLT